MTFDLNEFERFKTNNEKIPAIKRYRELTNLGLKEAKDEVDFFWDRGYFRYGHAAGKLSVGAPFPSWTFTINNGLRIVIEGLTETAAREIQTILARQSSYVR